MCDVFTSISDKLVNQLIDSIESFTLHVNFQINVQVYDANVIKSFYKIAGRMQIADFPNDKLPKVKLKIMSRKKKREKDNETHLKLPHCLQCSTKVRWYSQMVTSYNEYMH